jgi:hypothetical protein
VDGYAAPRERKRDATRADAELERRSVAGQVDEEVDDRVDHVRVGLVRIPLVEARRDGSPKWSSGTAAR